MKKMYNIYNNVKYFRGTLKLTQQELADLADVSRITIISIEKQRYEPSVGLAIRLAKIFSCKVEDLFNIGDE